MYPNTNYNMSISPAIYISVILFAKLNVSQFALHFISPNFMFTKYTAYTVAITSCSTKMKTNLTNFNVIGLGGDIVTHKTMDGYFTINIVANFSTSQFCHKYSYS